ncbi:MAG TPA: formyltetrahydrofolate deformylase [Gammaproteobacteria bacterium]|nr:formyltetrahydrofolate deformylase [Gammaproteobacteria bacterium]
MTGSRQSEDFYILNIACGSCPGIVAAVAGFMAARRHFILKMDQFDDLNSGTFYMRLVFRADPAERPGAEEVSGRFGEWVTDLDIRWSVHDAGERPRMILLASRQEHCLLDLLHRHRIGELKVDIPLVASNHRNLEGLVRSFGIPFVHLPVTDADRTAREEELVGLVEETGSRLVVLARYMQVLQPWICHRLEGRLINIHHSFLPSFAGADPYRQAYSRGVKLIGATAHYVTPELDAGPIIEQAVERVDHTYQPEDLVAAGRDLEKIALARAVRYHLEHRVFRNGDRTVVFR